MLVDNGPNSAISSGTITGYDYATGEEKIVTVNVDLTVKPVINVASEQAPYDLISHKSKE